MIGFNHNSFHVVQRLSHANKKTPQSSQHSVSPTNKTSTINNIHHHHISSEPSSPNIPQSDKLLDDRLGSTTNGSGNNICGKVSYRKLCCYSLHSCVSNSGSSRSGTRKIIYRTPFLFLILLLCAYIGQRILSFYSKNIAWEHPPYHFLPRTCTPPNYYTFTDYYNSIRNQSQSLNDGTSTIRKPKICITTLTDEANKSLVNKVLGWRNYDGIMALTWPNKYQYAQRHHYHVYDESHLVNHTRGPAWFKIVAVLRLLQVEQCDWVFWMDADMVIMNSTIQLEDFLPYSHDNSENNHHMDTTSASKTSTSFYTFPPQPNFDLLLSIDLRGSTDKSTSAGTTQLINGTRYSTTNTGVYNSGAWMIRNSEWSINFLTTWWNMKSYVQPIGHSFSGDNHALKDLLRHNVSDFNDHCLVPPRCTFNSFAKFVRSSSSIENPDPKLQQILLERTYHEAYYHQSDFVAHVAGVDNKRDTIQMLLELAQ